MPIHKSHLIKVWAGVVCFFAVGVAIALIVTLHEIDRGGSLASAILIGSFAGGYGAYLVFYVVLNALKWLRNRRKSARA